MLSLSLKDVHKSFGPIEVIKSAELDIGPGEFVVFVGPSGCGKSTLLRMIAGLEAVTDGTIEIGGKDVTRLPPIERNVAMVFQSYALYPHMNVADNIAFGLRIAGMPRAQRLAKAREAAKVLQLEALLDRRPKAAPVDDPAVHRSAASAQPDPPLPRVPPDQRRASQGRNQCSAPR